MTAAIHEIDPAISISGQASMSDTINQSPSAALHRSSAWVVGGFAAIAFLLGMFGLYGVVAYSVSQRTREIGIRMALGAPRKSVFHLILNEAGRLTAIGVTVGLVCSGLAASLMRGLLFGIQSWDVPTLAAVAALLAVSALLASYIPARRATRVDPMVALRYE
jgi:ABC-type antimicrobial peptide transport system permease subunit